MVFKQCSAKEKRRKIRIVILLAVAALLLSSCNMLLPIRQTEPGIPTETEEPSTSEETPTSPVEVQKPVTTLGVETGHYYDNYWDDASERIAASVQYPYMHLSESDRKAYSELEQSIAALMQERKESRMELYAEAVQAAKDAFIEDQSNPPFFEVTETVTVRRSDSRIFSLMLEGSSYTGGLHGQPYILGVVFDSETGERLKLADVVTDVALLPALVEEQLEAFWDMDYLYEDLDLQAFFETNLDSVSWVLDYYGLSIYFNPYEIAPYASGTQNVTIPFASHPELFKEEYCEVPASYGVEFSAEKPFFYDVNGDGETDALTVMAAKGEYYYYDVQTVTLNGEKFEENTGIFLIEPVLLHTVDGKNYLYLGQQYPDDFWVFEIFDLSKGTIEKIDTVYSGRHNIIDFENGYYARQVLTDPQSFMLDSYTLMLGTAYGYDSYHVGTNGLPVRDHDWYMICYEMELTLRKDLIVSVVGEDGKTTGTTELKAGDNVVYYRTDGESWADLKLADGRIVRINPQNNEDGEWMVDGMNLEEVFDGVVFGG